MLLPEAAHAESLDCVADMEPGKDIILPSSYSIEQDKLQTEKVFFFIFFCFEQSKWLEFFLISRIKKIKNRIMNVLWLSVEKLQHEKRLIWFENDL